jgi:hypothetical protein
LATPVDLPLLWGSRSAQTKQRYCHRQFYAQFVH